MSCFAFSIFPYMSFPKMRFCSILLALRETCIWLPSTYTKKIKQYVVSILNRLDYIMKCY